MTLEEELGETHARVWQLQERLAEEMKNNSETMAALREASELLLGWDESEAGRVFRPNKLCVDSCRCLEGPRIVQLLQQLRLIPTASDDEKLRQIQEKNDEYSSTD